MLYADLPETTRNLGLPQPVHSWPHSVWAIAPFDSRTDDDYGTTSIWHADIDCPAIRDWTASAGAHATTVMEINPDTSTFREWARHEDDLWSMVTDDFASHPMDLTDWRSCRRCGTQPSTPAAVCPHCSLTACDCDTW